MFCQKVNISVFYDLSTFICSLRSIYSYLSTISIYLHLSHMLIYLYLSMYIYLYRSTMSIIYIYLLWLSTVRFIWMLYLLLGRRLLDFRQLKPVRVCFFLPFLIIFTSIISVIKWDKQPMINFIVWKSNNLVHKRKHRGPQAVCLDRKSIHLLLWTVYLYLSTKDYLFMSVYLLCLSIYICLICLYIYTYLYIFISVYCVYLQWIFSEAVSPTLTKIAGFYATETRQGLLSYYTY